LCTLRDGAGLQRPQQSGCKMVPAVPAAASKNQ
jgi:hypothetical protein